MLQENINEEIPIAFHLTNPPEKIQAKAISPTKRKN